MTVRRATLGDVTAVARVARAAWADTYRDLLRPETIEAFVANAYSPERLSFRIAANRFYVAEGDAKVIAFADASVVDDRIVLHAIYADPARRRQGAGTALLEALLAELPPLPMTADVLVHNRKGEAFYERRGFAPRERLEASLFGEPVVERRWWRPPGSS